MKYVLLLFAFLGFLLFALPASNVASNSVVAANEFADNACSGAKGSASGASCGAGSFSSGLRNIINVVIFLVGAVAVIMIIIGGFRYVVSGGDSAGVEGAKNTILYAIIGLVVAFMAFAIVNFVIGGIKPSAGSGSGSGSGSGGGLNSTPSSGSPTPGGGGS